MIDNEIIKALEWCEQFENNIVFKGSGDERCVQALQMMVVIRHALKEYNRQKAEIERLQKANESFGEAGGKLVVAYKKVKSEARKEFAERLIERATKTTLRADGLVVEEEYKISREDLDNLLAEMEERE